MSHIPLNYVENIDNQAAATQSFAAVLQEIANHLQIIQNSTPSLSPGYADDQSTAMHGIAKKLLEDVVQSLFDKARESPFGKVSEKLVGDLAEMLRHEILLPKALKQRSPLNQRKSTPPD